MYRLIPFRSIVDVVLTGCLLGVVGFAQTARSEPDSEVILMGQKSDETGAFFLPDPESKAMVAAARASALNEIGTAAYARKDYDEAIAAFRRSIEDNPALSAVHLNLSIALTA